MAHGTLKSIRIEKGLSQKQMAEKLFVEQSTLSKYENKQLKMNDELITRISETFGIDPNDLKNENMGNTVFEDGSIRNGNGIGHIQNYYHVPKELLDSIVQQQQTLTAMLQVLTEKLK